ncbi:hypothetical protein F2P56_020027 [Juglans regia]|uniref:CCHC-type domain-containing protein n=1 Tax=Juglans regia TaxID=51240 RepID=A0A833UPZ7_JUGRE|nr:hypothetical protein F2P56_020027 [Juglans regia]
MSRENSIIRFNGKNYLSWEFQFKMFVKGKELWGHIDGTSSASKDPKELGTWEAKDARIVSWLLGSIEPHMVNNLRYFSTAKEMWEYLGRIYNQDNNACRFQLELEIANFSQGNLSIEQYYSGFLNLWSKYSSVIHAKVPKEALSALQTIHEESRRDQFLMKLRPEYDATRAGLLNRNPVPTLDVCLGELLREEQRLATQAGMGQEKLHTEMVNVDYAAQGRGRGKGQIQCYSCKEFGHIATNCTKPYCNYCKKPGHIIKECSIRPQNRHAQAFQAAVQSSPIVAPTVTATSTIQAVLTPEMVQQMIISAFSAFGLQGNGSGVGEGDRKGT